jgi:beta-galactosidase/beta-glucuronidase
MQKKLLSFSSSGDSMRPTMMIMMLGLVFSRLVYTEENDVPRSQQVNTPLASSVVLLDGDKWLLAIDPNNVGREEQWHKKPREEAKQTKVPWVIQDAFPGYHGVAWYWREFTPPDSLHEHSRYLVRFWAVDYKADVWLNGVHIGEHEGGESPFVLDVTSTIKPKQLNLLSVRVLNPTHEPIDGIVLNETPHRNKALPYSSGSAWDQGGIMDSVELVVVPAVRIDDLFARPDWKTGIIRIQSVVQNTLPNTVGAQFNFSVAPASGGQTIQTVSL